MTTLALLSLLLGQTVQNGSMTIPGGLTAHGSLSSALSTPTVSSVVNGGASGATNWCYKVTGLDAAGETVGSAAVCNGSGPATLTGVNTEVVTWAAIAGATGYNVYRTTAGGTPNTTGKMTGSSNVQGLTFTDTGTAGDATSPPSADSSGAQVSGAASGAVAFGVQNAGAIFCMSGSGPTCTDQLADSSGNMVLTTAAGKNYQFVSGNKVCLDGATCANSVDYGTSFAGFMTLTGNNLGIVLNGPTLLSSTLRFNGAAATSFDLLRSNAGSGSFAYRLFNDNGTTAILTLSPAGVLTATDNTPAHAVALTPGVNPNVTFGGGTAALTGGAAYRFDNSTHVQGTLNVDGATSIGSASTNDVQIAGASTGNPVTIGVPAGDANVSIAIQPRVASTATTELTVSGTSITVAQPINSAAATNAVINAPTGQNVQLQVNGVPVVTATATAVSLSQPVPSLTIGSGSPVANLAVGACTMSAGTTCTATTAGTTASSKCWVTQQAALTGGTCDTTPGAGSTQVSCASSNSGTFDVLCVN